jgi:hypothetical protein
LQVLFGGLSTVSVFESSALTMTFPVAAQAGAVAVRGTTA